MTTTEVRSKIMRAVSRKDTKPEIHVRSLLHGLGLRFRLHKKNLPGTPDIVLHKYRTAIFVHGCFWHRHQGCRFASTPKTKQEFWLPKFASNVRRDSVKEAQLRELGWKVLIVWECETRSPEQLKDRLVHEFFDSDPVGDS